MLPYRVDFVEEMNRIGTLQTRSTTVYGLPAMKELGI